MTGGGSNPLSWFNQDTLPPQTCSSGRRVMQASHRETQLLHHIADTRMHKYLLTKFLTSYCEQTQSLLLVPPALRRVTPRAGALRGAASTAPGTTPYQPRSETVSILPAKKGIWKDLLYLGDWLLHTSSLRVPPTIFISSASVEFHHRLVFWGWMEMWPTSQGQVHSLRRQETTVWGKGRREGTEEI